MSPEHFGPLQPSVAIDVAILMTGLIASALNIVLLRILFSEELRIDGGLMVTIALFDVTVDVFMFCSVVARWINPLAQKSYSLCLVSSIVFNSTSVLTPMLVAQLSYVRYLAIVRGVVLEKGWIFSSLAMVLLVWGMFLWRGLASELILLPSGAYCTPLYWGPHFADKAFGLVILLFVLPSLLAIPICYYYIMAHYKASISFEGSNGHLAKRQLRRYAMHIVLVMVAYGMNFIPELIHIFLTIVFNVTRTAISDGVVMVLLLSITITNALFSLLLHEDTRLIFTALINGSFSTLNLSLLIN